jgi:hypothetical protein
MSWRQRIKRPTQRTYRCRCGAVAVALQLGQPLCPTCPPVAPDDMREEYDFTGGERGRYCARLTPETPPKRNPK